MTVRLNHTVVHCRDRIASAAFFTEMYGLPEARSISRFRAVKLANGVSLDFADSDRPIAAQHYAMLVSEAEFDAVMERIKEKGLDYWADPGRTRQGQINHRDGGRGVYFLDPNGHVLEALTVPYHGFGE